MTRLLALALALSTLPFLGAAPASAASGPVLSAHRSSLGRIVVGAHGRTVYAFDLDRVGTRTSACTGACRVAWPAVTFTGTARSRPRVVGLTGRVGSIPAGAGRRQITLAGRPLYYYAGDAGAGQVNGQGSGGIWWVVTPRGAEITD